MKFSHEDIERVARRLCDRVGEGRQSWPGFDRVKPDVRDHYRDMAKVALEAFGAVPA